MEQTANRQVRVTGGFNDFDFGYLLKPGQSLELIVEIGFKCAMALGYVYRQGSNSAIVSVVENEHRDGVLRVTPSASTPSKF